MVHSEKRQLASEKKFVRNLDKRLEQARKSWKKLRAKEFACEPDAHMAARLWFDDYPYLSDESIQVFSKTKKKTGRKSRPGKDEAVETIYLVDSPLEIIPDVIEQEKARLGRFILATNDLDLDPDIVLKYYKGQQSVERGFRFLKDKSFRVTEVFLKKKSRIEALSMIMVLCLFV